MKLKKWIAVSVGMLTLATLTRVMADENTDPTQQLVTTDRAHDSTEPFSAHQLSLQAFATYATRNREGSSRNGLGGGLGLTYFFTRYIGIGADTYIEEWKLPYRVNGSLILRLPLPEQFSRLAVYGFGGGGRQFKDFPQYTWHGGAGLEYAFSHRLGIFTDAREVFPNQTPNYFYMRAGVNFGF